MVGTVSRRVVAQLGSRRGAWRRRLTGLLACVLSAVLVATLADVPAIAQQQEEPDWQPPAAPEVDSVPVSPVVATPLQVGEVGNVAVRGDREVSWPQPLVARAVLPDRLPRGIAVAGQPPRTGTAERVPAEGTPVRIGPARLTPEQAALRQAGVADAAPEPPAEVTVLVADRQAADQAGIAGVVLGIARTDGKSAAARVAVEVDYSGFRHAYGGNWANRLRLVTLADCGESVGLRPAQPGCGAASPLPTRNDVRAGVLVAEVPLSAGGGYTMVAVTSDGDSAEGDYTATDLSPAATWDVSAQTGAFSWDYPLRVPPGVGGPEPSLSLTYSSQAVDGLTSNTNTQGSWIGDGWELWPGYIERSYRSCSQDTDAVSGQEPNNADDETGDQCWVSDNATMSLNGGATELVKDGANRFRPVDDDGTRIERLTGTSFGNGTHNGEYWKVTTPDGTQYFFGRHRRDGFPTDTAATNSTWTVPVYGNHPGEPCHAAGDFGDSRCTQGWRWNLDYIIDPHGNTMTLFYSRETGAYGREGEPSRRTTYHRGGYLTRIEYGTRAGDEASSPAPLRVLFDVADRCNPGSTCNQSTPSSWPDTPWDQYCDASPCTDQLSPTFWTQKRLDRIRTQVRGGGSYSTVESWELEHEWLDAGDSDGEAVPMWLTRLTRTGHVTTAGGQQVSDPQISFDPGADPLPNRVKGHEDGFSAMNRWRMRGIGTESGAYIGISYSVPECDPEDLPTPHTNGERCYPQWYTPSEGFFEPELHWFHKYVVSEVNVHDETGASPTQRTTWEYLDDPAWAYADSELVPEDKRTWSQWRGHSKVRVVQGTPEETQSATEYLYLRGMHGDRAGPNGGTRSVQVTDSQGVSITDHKAHSGFLREQTVLDGSGGRWVTGSIHTPWRHGPTATSGPLESYLTGTATDRGRTRLEDGSARWTRTDTSFDTTYGMPTQVNDRGDESTTADDLCTRYEYARNTSIGMVDRVSRTEIVSTRCSQTPDRPGDVVSDQRTFYDHPDTHGSAPNRGLPVKVQEVASWNGTTPVWVTVERNTYDQQGRIVAAEDALGNSTTTTYTPATGGPVTEASSTSPLGHTVTTVKEPAWDLPVETVDANGHITELAYDGLGRLTEVWLPGRDRGNQGGNLQFDYLIRDDAPSAVTTRKLTPLNTYRTSITLYDGQLRERQVQTQAPGGGRVISDTLRDSRSLIEWESKEYYNAQEPSTILVGTAGQLQIPGVTEYVYDGAERVTDEILKRNGQEEWRTSYSYGGDRTHTTPPDGGTATTTITDARDQTVALRQYHGPAPTGSHDETTYTYTPRGELATVTDPVGNIWSYTYDQRGREVEVVDPDKGTTTTTYDAAGQPVSVTDARGRTLGFTYDALGRQTSVRDGSTTGALRAEWEFDTLPNGIGKLSRAIRHDGGADYINEVVGYDSAGRPTGTRVVVPSTEDGLGGDYTTLTTYRVDGSVATTTLPAIGGLPQERMVFSYNDVGAPTGLTSPHGLYTFDVTYNKLGELTQRVLGSFGKRTSLTYLIDEATSRLVNTSGVNEQRGELVDLAYSYDDAGNLLRIGDSPKSAVATDTQCYAYDQLRRLVEAWTPAAGHAGNCDSAPSVATLGGPAPYWHSWSYDQTGNRLSEVVHAAGGDVTTTYTHPAAGSPQPHVVTEAQRSGPGGNQLSTYDYDAAGNLVERTVVGEGQSLEYDAEGNLAQVTDADGGVHEYVYDADGNRLIRRDPAGSTLYLPDGQELRWDQATNTTECTRYYTHIDVLIAVRTPGELAWVVADHHNTAEIMLRDAGMTVGQQRTTPFGATRGAAPAFWAGDKGFVGGTDDPTGLVHLGARMYDETLGRFLSVDPVIDHFDPQRMHAYAYGNNSPPTFTDPNGLFFKKAWDKAKSTANSVTNAAEAVGSAVASGVSTAANATANWAKETVNTIKEDPWKFAAEVAVGVAVGVAIGAACAATAGVGCVVAAGVLAGAAAAGAGYGVDVAQGDREFSVKDLGTEMAIGGAVGGLTAGVGAGASGLGRAALRTGTRKPPTCSIPNSFVPGTAVALADGGTKPIEEIELGDEVLATDPQTRVTAAEDVVATIVGAGEKTLVEIVVRVDGEESAVTATDRHPFWVAEPGAWLPAAALTVGDELLTANGAEAEVVSVGVAVETVVVHNLTVSGLHTYYVEVVGGEVLVHNCGGSLDPNNVRSHAKPNLWERIKVWSTPHVFGADKAESAARVGQAIGTGIDSATPASGTGSALQASGYLYGWAKGFVDWRKGITPKYVPQHAGYTPKHRAGKPSGSGRSGGGTNVFI